MGRENRVILAAKRKEEKRKNSVSSTDWVLWEADSEFRVLNVY